MAVSLRELWQARPAGEHPAGEHDDPSVRDRHIARVDSATQQRSADANAECIARIRGGDEGAFDALFRAEYPSLVGFVTTLVGEADVAHDVVAEVFSRIWRLRHAWAPQGGDVRGYLFRAVKNQAANTRRGERRRETLRAHVINDGATRHVSTASDAAVEHAELIAKLWCIIDSLPPQRRSVAYLRWREGMEYDEISVITGQSIAAIKMQVSRTLSALRQILPDLID